MSNKLTDEQIAELAPEWATHVHIYSDHTLVFQTSDNYQFYSLIDGLYREKYKHKELHSMAKPIPRKKFDISEYEFSDAANDSGVEFRCSLWAYPDIEINVKDVNGGDNTAVLMKEHAIALAKHFKLTSEDLK